MRLAQNTANVVIRLLASLVTPAWGLVTIGLGVGAESPWWIATGILITIIAAVTLIGSPLMRRFLYDT
jgi:hypothetical protein